jgi:hypothetical protein
MQHGTIDSIPTYRKRPLPVAVLAILFIIQGIVAILAGIFAMINLTSIIDTLSIQGHVVTHLVINVISYVLGGMSLVLGIALIVLAVGLWRLRRWAFWTTVALLIVNLAIQIALFIRPHTQNAIEIVSLVISALLLLYALLIPKVRRAFLSREPSPYRR